MQLLEFPDDIILEITYFLPVISLIRFLGTSKNLWNLRERRYRLSNTKQNLQTSLLMFRECVSLKDWAGGLTISIRQNCLECVGFFLKKLNPLEVDWDHSMEEAAECGSLDLIQMCISKGANNWDSGLRFAAKGGHKTIMEFFLDRGATDWNDALRGASHGGHQHIVEYSIQKGANDWNNATRCAAIGGHTKIMEYFVQKGLVKMDFALKLSYNKETAKFLVHHDPKKIPDTFMSAIHENQIEVLQYLTETKPDIVLPLMNKAMATASERGLKHLVEYFVEHGANDWNRGLIGAVRSDNTELVHYFIDKGATDWNGALCAAIPKEKNRNLIDLFIEKGANDWDRAIRTLQNLEEWEIWKEHAKELLKLFKEKSKKRKQSS